MALALHELLASVDQRKAQLDANRPLAPGAVKSLREKLNLDWTHQSNAIEGNTLTLHETKAVLEDGITIQGKPLREHFEAVNHQNAIEAVETLVEKNEAVTAWNIRGIHSLVLRSIKDKDAGRYRTENVVITGAHHEPPSHWRLDEEMGLLERWYSTDAQQLHPIERAAQLHTRFVVIHPFSDGNGRTARLLLNFELMKAGYPIAVIRHEDRVAYYAALDAAGTRGDYESFTRIVAETVNRSLDLYLRVAAGPELKTAGSLRELCSSPASHTDFLKHVSQRIDAYPGKGDPGTWLHSDLRKTLRVENLPFPQALHLSRLKASSRQWDIDATDPAVLGEIIQLTEKIQRFDPDYALRDSTSGYERIAELSGGASKNLEGGSEPSAGAIGQR